MRSTPIAIARLVMEVVEEEVVVLPVQAAVQLFSSRLQISNKSVLMLLEVMEVMVGRVEMVHQVGMFSAANHDNVFFCIGVEVNSVL